MKAAVLVQPGQVEVGDIAEPHCGPDDVIVRVQGVGLCGTDLSVQSGSRVVAQLPWVLGHEGVGEIVAVGDRVTDRRTGQRVAIEPNYCCFDCRECGKGFTSACPNRVAVGIGTPGLLAEFVAVPARFSTPVADHVDLADLVCAEPLTVARAAIRRSGISAGQSCVVVGAGSQGLLLCASLLAEGVKPFVIEPRDGRRELALALGAVEADRTTAGVEYVFETSGVPAAVRPALERLAPGGTAVLVGLSPTPFEVSTFELVYRQLRIVGSLIYDHPGDFADTAAVLNTRALAPGRVLQDAFSLDEAADAFKAVHTAAAKCWIRLD